MFDSPFMGLGDVEMQAGKRHLQQALWQRPIPFRASQIMFLVQQDLNSGRCLAGEGQQATSVNTTIAPAPAVIPAKLPQVGVDEEQQAIDEKVKKEVAAKEAERKQYCEKMRTNLAQLENNPRLREEVNGEVRRLDEDERQKRIAEAKKAIAENCQ